MALAVTYPFCLGNSDWAIPTIIRSLYSYAMCLAGVAAMSLEGSWRDDCADEQAER